MVDSNKIEENNQRSHLNDGNDITSDMPDGNDDPSGNAEDTGTKKKFIPDCFGKLDIVFPMGSHGLRETPDNCMYLCAFKTACLKKAMEGVHGINVREEIVERCDKSGIISFFERWSKKKSLYKEKEQTRRKEK